MLHFAKKRPAAALVLLCYSLAALVYLVVHLYGFAANRAAYASGGLDTATLQVQDFTLYDLEEQNGALVSIGSDPQMILNDASLRVENLRVEWAAAQAPWTVMVFWAPPGGPYTLWDVAYAEKDEAGFAVQLPAAGGQSLRIDPDTRAGNRFYIKSITVNEPAPLWRFFVPRVYEAAAYLTVPALLACALSLLPRPKRPAAPAKAGDTHG